MPRVESPRNLQTFVVLLPTILTLALVTGSCANPQRGVTGDLGHPDSDPFGRHSDSPRGTRPKPVPQQTPSSLPAGHHADGAQPEQRVGEPSEIAAEDSVLRQSSAQHASRRDYTQTPRPVPLTLPTDVSFGNYYGLVIGNNGYTQLPELRTARHDARSVAELLTSQYGYDVTLLEDADRSSIVSALSGYRNSLGPDDNLLIYYAGHGWNDSDAGEAYWLPVDASKQDQAAWISNATITQMIRAMKARHVIVVADSCYAGTLTRGISIRDEGPDFIERLAARRSRTALSSGGNEPVEDGGPDGHSVFAAAFIHALEHNESIIDATDLYGNLRRRVMLDAHQSPQYGDIRLAGHEDGDFLFIRTD